MIRVKIQKGNTGGMWYEFFENKCFNVIDTDYDYFQIKGTNKIIYKEHCIILKNSTSKEEKQKLDSKIIELFKTLEDNRSCAISSKLDTTKSRVDTIVTDYYRNKLENKQYENIQRNT